MHFQAIAWCYVDRLLQQRVDLPHCLQPGRGAAIMVARLQLLQEAAAAAARASALLEAAALEADLAEAPLDADTEEGGSPVLCAQAKSQGRKLPALRSPSPSRWVPMASPASEAGAFPAPPPPPPAPPCNWPAAERQQPPPLRKPLRTEEMRSERRRSRTRRRGHTGAERGRGSKLGKRTRRLQVGRGVGNAM